MFNFCSIFDLLTSRTQKIAWRSPAFKPDFIIFSYNEKLNLKKIHRQVFIYHTSLILEMEPQINRHLLKMSLLINFFLKKYSYR